jgi:hypothetical protein
MLEENCYYVYLLLDPSKDDEPFYIGKGKGKRVKDHYTPGYLKKNNYKSNIINLYRSKGHQDKYIILKDSMTNQEAYDWETWFILEYYGMKTSGGLLVNQTTGGGGTPGFAAPRTPEWLEKLSNAQKGREVSEQTRRLLSQRAKEREPASDESRAKMSASKKGKPKSPEHVEKVRQANIGKFVSDETRAKISKSTAGIYPGRASKWYKMTSPEGEEFIVLSKRQFCLERGLSAQHMGNVALGTRNHHKGWKCEFYFSEENKE